MSGGRLPLDAVHTRQHAVEYYWRGALRLDHVSSAADEDAERLASSIRLSVMPEPGEGSDRRGSAARKQYVGSSLKATPASDASVDKTARARPSEAGTAAAVRPGLERLILADLKAALMPSANAMEVRVSRSTIQHVITAAQCDRQ